MQVAVQLCNNASMLHLHCNFFCMQIWIAVHSNPYARDHWSDSFAENIEFIREMLLEAQLQKFRPGIFTIPSDWKSITGDTHEFKNFPLFYEEKDGKGSFNPNFEPFGGWRKPTIKQYNYTNNLCDISGLGIITL
jgi:hypothetical protein